MGRPSPARPFGQVPGRTLSYERANVLLIGSYYREGDVPRVLPI